MRVRYALRKIIIGGLLAGMLAFGGLYAWNVEQATTDAGVNGTSSQLATTGTGGQIADRD